ncbi:MAG: hypothetical protein LBB51_04815 [Zoogloeaceae bacterium]|jgi:hypothetical protein|nr:hypothetical protein [Zoogloeaceae bacterium]
MLATATIVAIFVFLVCLWGTAGFLLFVSTALLLALFSWISKKPFLIRQRQHARAWAVPTAARPVLAAPGTA